MDVIAAPFHAGVEAERVGKGPSRLLAAGLTDALRNGGAEVRLVRIGAVDRHEGEIGRSFEVMRRVAVAVVHARAAGRFPLVLAGNCNASAAPVPG